MVCEWGLSSVVDGFTYRFMVVVYGWWFLVGGFWLMVYVLYRDWAWTSCLSSQLLSTIQWFLVDGSSSFFCFFLKPRPWASNSQMISTIQWSMVYGLQSMVDGLWLMFMEVEVMVDGLYVVDGYGWWFLVNGLP
jgi:hypothetical protein